MTELARR